MARKKQKGIMHYTGTAVIYTSKGAMYFFKGLYTVLDGIGSAVLFTSKKVQEKRTKIKAVK